MDEKQSKIAQNLSVTKALIILLRNISKLSG